MKAKKHESEPTDAIGELASAELRTGNDQSALQVSNREGSSFHLEQHDSGDDTSSSQSDSDFNPSEALLQDSDAIIQEFTDDFIASLDREYTYYLALLLFRILHSYKSTPHPK
jgi:hypothetical protein